VTLLYHQLRKIFIQCDRSKERGQISATKAREIVGLDVVVSTPQI
jgi:hypothetical protein